MSKTEEKAFIKVWDGEVPDAVKPAESKITPVGVEPEKPANPFATVDPNLVGLAAVFILKHLREAREAEAKEGRK